MIAVGDDCRASRPTAMLHRHCRWSESRRAATRLMNREFGARAFTPARTPTVQEAHLKDHRARRGKGSVGNATSTARLSTAAVIAPRGIRGGLIMSRTDLYLSERRPLPGTRPNLVNDEDERHPAGGRIDLPRHAREADAQRRPALTAVRPAPTPSATYPHMPGCSAWSET